MKLWDVAWIWGHVVKSGRRPWRWSDRGLSQGAWDAGREGAWDFVVQRVGITAEELSLVEGVSALSSARWTMWNGFQAAGLGQTVGWALAVGVTVVLFREAAGSDVGRVEREWGEARVFVRGRLAEVGVTVVWSAADLGGVYVGWYGGRLAMTYESSAWWADLIARSASGRKWYRQCGAWEGRVQGGSGEGLVGLGIEGADYVDAGAYGLDGMIEWAMASGMWLTMLERTGSHTFTVAPYDDGEAGLELVWVKPQLDQCGVAEQWVSQTPGPVQGV